MTSIGKMRLRAEIVVELDAADFIDAAAHQSRLQDLVSKVSQMYPETTLTIRERRDRGPKAVEARPSGRSTGRLHRYG